MPTWVKVLDKVWPILIALIVFAFDVGINFNKIDSLQNQMQVTQNTSAATQQKVADTATEVSVISAKVDDLNERTTRIERNFDSDYSAPDTVTRVRPRLKQR